MEDFVGSRPLTIPVLPGVGFGVIAGESAVLHAVGMLARPRRAWLGLMPDLGTRSPGAVASTLRTLALGGAVVANGNFVAERAGRRSFTAILAGRKETFVSMPLGELWAVHRSTGMADLIGGVARPASERVLLQSGALGVLARSESIRRWLVSRVPRGGAQDERVFESKVWARAQDAD